jgi:hypothetical protein
MGKFKTTNDTLACCSTSKGHLTQSSTAVAECLRYNIPVTSLIITSKPPTGTAAADICWCTFCDILTLKHNKTSDAVALLVAASYSSLLSLEVHIKQFYIISHTSQRSLICCQANVNNGLNLKDITSQTNAHIKLLTLYIQHVFLTVLESVQ